MWQNANTAHRNQLARLVNSETGSQIVLRSETDTFHLTLHSGAASEETQNPPLLLNVYEDEQTARQAFSLLAIHLKAESASYSPNTPS